MNSFSFEREIFFDIILFSDGWINSNTHTNTHRHTEPNENPYCRCYKNICTQFCDGHKCWRSLLYTYQMHVETTYQIGYCAMEDDFALLRFQLNPDNDDKRDF